MNKIRKNSTISSLYRQVFRAENLPLIPIIIALVIVPLIVRVKVMVVPGSSLVWSTGPEVQLIDIFAYYKGFWLIIAALAGLIILLVQFNHTKSFYEKNKPQYLLAGYMLLVVLSFFFSTNRNVSFTGYNEHFENVFVLIAYIILFSYTSAIVTSEVQLRTLVNLWIISIVIMFIIGLTQYFNRDFFTTTAGTFLIIPNAFRSSATANQDSDTLRNVYQTLFHYNYVSFYAGMGFPFFLVLSFLESEKRRRWLYIGITLIFAFNQYASLSRNGLVGITIAGFVALIFLRNRLFKKWYLFVPALIAIVVTAGFFVTTSDSFIATRLRDAVKSSVETQVYPLRNIVTYKGYIDINHEQFELDVDYLTSAGSNQIAFDFLNPEGDPYEFYSLQKDHRYGLKGIDEKVLNFQLGKLNDQDAIFITIDGQVFNFVYTDRGFIYLNAIGLPDIIPEVESFGFEGRERFGSARGYIWSRTLPLFKDYGLLGSGPDTFALVFPQNDYVGKYQAYNTPNMVVDKPHNLFLNYAINTGLPSLICLLLFWGWYLFTSFRLYIKHDFDLPLAKYGLASTMAVIGYLTSGLFNDTNLNVTPLFWIILGIGYAVNLAVTKETESI